jgi:hypothetical protein
MDEENARREILRAEQERRFLEQQPLRAAMDALKVCEDYIQCIIDFEPILHTPGGDRCAFGCGYGTVDGAEDETEVNLHRDACLWIRAPGTLRFANRRKRMWEQVEIVPVPQQSREEYKQAWGQYPPDPWPPDHLLWQPKEP